LGVEIVMAISGYQSFNIWTAMAAGAAASQFGTTWTAVLFGWDPATAKDVWLAVPINLISGLVLSGLLGFYLAKGLARTGLIRSASSQT
jgi:ABC-type thiamin/hydroxymethylpyrimidine transport system permease subunit